MPRTLFDCIGNWFEDVIQAEMPSLSKVDDQNGTRPDFDHPFFGAEAKVGYWEYGAQLKERQVRKFGNRGKPIVYIVGYHTAHGLRRATSRMDADQIDDHLECNVGVHSVYLVSNRVIQKLWRKENHAAASNPDWKYFSVRPRHLDAIIQNRAFGRSGVRHMPSRWYGLCRPELLLIPAPYLAGQKKGLKFGTILHREHDKPVIEYIAAQGLI